MCSTSILILLMLLLIQTLFKQTNNFIEEMILGIIRTLTLMLLLLLLFIIYVCDALW